MIPHAAIVARAVLYLDMPQRNKRRTTPTLFVLEIIEPVRIAKDRHLRALNNLYNITRRMLR